MDVFEEGDKDYGSQCPEIILPEFRQTAVNQFAGVFCAYIEQLGYFLIIHFLYIPQVNHLTLIIGQRVEQLLDSLGKAVALFTVDHKIGRRYVGAKNMLFHRVVGHPLFVLLHIEESVFKAPEEVEFDVFNIGEVGGAYHHFVKNVMDRIHTPVGRKAETRTVTEKFIHVLVVYAGIIGDLFVHGNTNIVKIERNREKLLSRLPRTHPCILKIYYSFFTTSFVLWYTVCIEKRTIITRSKQKYYGKRKKNVMQGRS